MGLLSFWRRRVAVLVTAAAVMAPATSAFAQAAPTDPAKASLADGDKAAKAKDWKSAIASYDAANKASPSEQTLDSLANAYYQAGDLGGAYSAYTEWTDKYGSKAGATKKKIAETRLKELTDKTGGVTVTVSEPGAIVMVDDKPVGTSPLPGQLRLTAGPHHFKITKDGFIAFDQSPTVATGTTTAVTATLAAANAKTKLTVTDKGLHQVRVIIDGIDRGPAPWSGDIDPGPHEVVLKGAGFASPVQKFVVGSTPVTLDLATAPASAPVKLATDDGKGQIFIDGGLVGQGTFAGELASGTHELKITRDGYDTITTQIVVNDREGVNKTFSMQLTQNVQTQEIVKEVDRPEGIYGGFNIVGFATPGGTGNSVEQQCDTKSQVPTLRSCSTPDGLGAGLGGFIGYHWDPVGIELFVAGDYDQRKDKETWDSAVATGASANPARTEDYTIRRYGVMALIRVRLTKQWKNLRLTLPFGAGVSYRAMHLERDAAGIGDNTHSIYSPSSESYTSPTIAIDPTVAYRLTPGVAVTLGVQFFLEAPASFLDGRNNPVTTASTTQKLGTYGISTPPYTLAANAQIFIGPVIGMMFGP